ncbi:MAG: phosphonate C-P lyase system protein PhnH [Hyphomicrobiaceae bacterium]
MTENQLATVASGFADPVVQMQSTFRSIMSALATPGRLMELSSLPIAPTALPPAMTAIVLTLADYETPIWLSRNLASDASVVSFLAFRTGAPVTDDTKSAAFAIATGLEALPSLDQFSQGSQEYPDRSATIVLEMKSLAEGPPISLEGPGIKDRATVRATPLPIEFWNEVTRNRERFPCGVDLILTCGNALVGLPRSIKVIE